MIDAIKLSMQTSPQEEDFLINRFALFKVTERNFKTYWHNKQSSNLNQNFGIYIKITEKKTYIQLSLHKFYNLKQGLKLSNYNDFSFSESNEAIRLLSELLNIEDLIFRAKIDFYEYGLNLQMDKPIKEYTKDLKAIKTGKQKKPFTWNVYYKRFKVYSTERQKAVRTVYVMYDKTFESKESGFFEVPENLLRIEIKHKRPPKLLLAELLSENLQSEMKSRIKRTFIDNAEFEKIPKKGIFSKNEISIYLDYENLGFADALQKYEEQKQAGAISQRTFQRRKKTLEMFAKTGVKPEFSEKETTKEFKQKIVSKLAQLENRKAKAKEKKPIKFDNAI